MTRQGRIAVLTNYREENQDLVQGARSRGLIPNAWLKSDPDSTQTSTDFARQMIEKDGVQGVGGFSLCYGFVQDVAKGEGLVIVSNRTPDVDGVIHLLRSRDETTALSNAAYGDRAWPKVVSRRERDPRAARGALASRSIRRHHAPPERQRGVGHVPHAAAP
jgi:uncharacterized protein with NRDE domain